MNKLIYVILLAILSEPVNVHAQIQLTGTTVAANSNERLPYVNIGIRYKNIGTISDENGAFSISIPAQHKSDTLTFSIIGYKELNIAIEQLEGMKTFSLYPFNTKMTEVVISSKKLREKKYGLSKQPMLHFLDASVNQHDIFEIAQIVKLGKEPAKITSINLLIHNPRKDSGTFRINFYSYTNNRPGKRIVETNITQTHAIKESWLRFDVSKYGISLKGDIIVAIEFIPTAKETQPIVYEIKPGGAGKCFVRTNSLGSWSVPPHQYRMFVTVKGGTELEVPEEAEDQITPAFSMFSTNVNDSFFLYVRLPENYNANGKQYYPVIYLLDGNYFFSSTVSVLDTMRGQQPILIGIGYSNLIAMDSLRDRDYTYPIALPADSFIISGGAEKFYAFICNELRPQVEKLYRVDTNNLSLMGHSLGGYFTLYALYKSLSSGEMPLKNYIAASPSIEYYNEYLVTQFEQIRVLPRNKQASVFICYGGMEDEEGTAKKYSEVMKYFIKKLSDKHLNSLSIDTACYQNAGHMETGLPGFSDGLRRIMNNTQ